MKMITVEEHFSVPGTSPAASMGSSGNALAGNAMDPGLVGGADSKGLSLDDDRVAAMDASGIDMQVLSSPETRLDRVRETNDYLHDAAQRYPGRFAGFATLPWTDAGAAVTEFRRCVDSFGFVGAFVTNRVEDQFLDAERFDPILKAATEFDVPINIHPGLPPEVVRNASYGGLSPMVSAIFSSFGYGWHVDTGIHALHLILSGVFDRYPTLQIILGHWGELIPYYLPRLEDRMPPRVTGLNRRITDYFISNFHISPSGIFDYRPLQLCIEMIGVERILYAVDYPIMGLEGARPFLENAPIPEADKEKIAHGNVERLLRL